MRSEQAILSELRKIRKTIHMHEIRLQRAQIRAKELEDELTLAKTLKRLRTRI